MPKFFCKLETVVCCVALQGYLLTNEGDYCDVYLTHDSMSVRKAHNSGRNHLRNVVEYYQQIGHEKAQSVIDSITSSYDAEGQSSSNPMLGRNPGVAPFPPPFGFPAGGIPPPPFPMAGLPGGMIPPPNGRGVPPMPTLPNGLPFPPPGGLPFPPPGGMPPLPNGMAFPPPGGMPPLPPNFQFQGAPPMGGQGGGFQGPPPPQPQFQGGNAYSDRR